MALDPAAPVAPVAPAAPDALPDAVLPLPPAPVALEPAAEPALVAVVLDDPDPELLPLLGDAPFDSVEPLGDPLFPDPDWLCVGGG